MSNNIVLIFWFFLFKKIWEFQKCKGVKKRLSFNNFLPKRGTFFFMTPWFTENNPDNIMLYSLHNSMKNTFIFAFLGLICAKISPNFILMLCKIFPNNFSHSSTKYRPTRAFLKKFSSFVWWYISIAHILYKKRKMTKSIWI